jgi:hypothetical protein
MALDVGTLHAGRSVRPPTRNATGSLRILDLLGVMNLRYRVVQRIDRVPSMKLPTGNRSVQILYAGAS